MRSIVKPGRAERIFDQGKVTGMPIVYLSNQEYAALKAVVDGKAVRAADLGPWSNADTGALIDHTLNRLRTKNLTDVPARGGIPALTQDGHDSMAYHEAQAEEQAGQR